MPFDFGGEKLYESKFIEEEPALDYRFVREAQATGYELHNPLHIASYFKEHIYTPWEQFTQEELFVLMCDTRNVVRYEAMVYRGTIDAVHIRIGEIFRAALIYNTPTIALAHNHPSSNPEPSSADIAVTRNIVDGGKLLGVHVLDHCVIGKDSYASMLQKQIGGL